MPRGKPTAKPRRRISRQPVEVSQVAIWAFGLYQTAKSALVVLIPIALTAWGFLGPYVDAQAEALLRSHLIQIGMDPASIQALNKNLTDLNASTTATTDSLRDDINSAKDIGTKNAQDLQTLKAQTQLILDLLSKAQEVK